MSNTTQNAGRSGLSKTKTWQSEIRCLNDVLYKMKDEKIASDAKHEAEVRSLKEEISKMTEEKKTSDDDYKSLLSELNATRLLLGKTVVERQGEQTELAVVRSELEETKDNLEGREDELRLAKKDKAFVQAKSLFHLGELRKDLASVRTELRTIKDSLKDPEHELRLAREEKAKRPREQEEDEPESRKRQRHSSEGSAADTEDTAEELVGQSHPLVVVADTIATVVDELPLSMRLEHYPSLRVTADVIGLLFQGDGDLHGRLLGFTWDAYIYAPDVNVPYCVRALIQTGLGPEPLPCICEKWQRCLVITKNGDGTVYFGHY